MSPEIHLDKKFSSSDLELGSEHKLSFVGCPIYLLQIAKLSGINLSRMFGIMCLYLVK